MADRNVTIFLRGDASQLTQALATASGAVRNFNSQVNGSGGLGSAATGATAAGQAFVQMGTSATQAGGQIRTFASIAGMASAVIASFQAQSNVFSGIAAGVKTLGMEILTVMPIVLGVRLAMQAITEGTRFMIESFMEFDKEMTFSTAIMGDLTDSMKNGLKEAVLDVAKTTTFSAAEAAKGLYYIASAGFNAESSLQALPVAAKFAQAGMIDLEKATKDLMTVTSSYGLIVKDAFGQVDAEATTKEMERVSDVISKASIDSNSEIEEMAQAMSGKAGGAARALGKSVEETAAVLSVFANVGIRGATAGTQLQIVWRDLQRRAIENADAFKQYNIQVFDSNGQMRNTGAILQQMQAAMGGLSDEAQKAAMAQLGFADRSVQSILAIMDLGGEVQKYQAHLMAAGGTTREVAEKQLGSLSSQLKILQNNIGNFAVEAGGTLVGWASKVGNALDPLVDSVFELTSALWKASEPMRNLTATAIGGFAAPFAAAVVPLTTIVSKISSMPAALGVIDTMIFMKLFAMALPYLNQLVASMGRFVASVVTGAGAAVSALVGGMNAAGRVVSSVFTNMGLIITGNARQIELSSTGAFMRMSQAAARSAQEIMRAYNQAGQGIAGSMAAAGQAAGQAFSGMRSGWEKAKSANIGGYISGLMMGIMAYKAGVDQARAASEQFVASVTQPYDMTSIDGLNKGYANLAAEQNKAVDKFNDTMGESSVGMFDTNNWNRAARAAQSFQEGIRGVDDGINKTIADEEKLSAETAKWSKVIENLNEGHSKFGASTEIVAAAAKIAGVELNKPLNDAQWKAVGDAIAGIGADATLATGGVVDMATMTKVAMDQMYADTEQTKKDLVSVWNEMADAAKAYEGAVVGVKDATEIFNDVVEAQKAENDRLEEIAKAEAKRQSDASKSQIDAVTKAQTDALNDQKQAALDQLSVNSREISQGVKTGQREQTQAAKSGQADTEDLTDAQVEAIKNGTSDKVDAIKDDTSAQVDTIKDGSTAARRAIENDYEGRIEQIRAGAEAQKEALESSTVSGVDAPTIVGASQILAGFDAQIAAVEEKTAKLNDLARLGASAALLEFMKGLEPEQFKPMYEQLIADNGKFITEFNTSFAKLGKLDSKPAWEMFKTNIQEQSDDIKGMNKNMTTLVMEANANPAMLVEMVKNLQAQGLDPASAMQVMVDQLHSGEAGRQEVVTMLDQWKTLSQQSIPEAAANWLAGANLMYGAATGNADIMTKALETLDPNTWEQQMKDMGFDDAMIQMIRDNLITRVDTLHDEAKTKLLEIIDMMKGVDNWEKRRSNADNIVNNLQAQEGMGMTDAQKEAAKAFVRENQLLDKDGNNTREFKMVKYGDEITISYVDHGWQSRNGTRVEKKINEDGNIYNGSGVKTFANGSENHTAQIAGAGAMRLWAEPETGGEAYIPLGASKRGRSVGILESVAKMFGYSLQSYSEGAASAPLSYHQAGGSGNQVVAVPVQTKSITNFNGPIIGVDLQTARADAARIERRNNLTRG